MNSKELLREPNWLKVLIFIFLKRFSHNNYWAFRPVNLAIKYFQKILGKLKDVEQELEAIGDNMKQLEISAEKAQEREEKLKEKIHTLMERLKVAEARFEYGEMNVSKLNLRYTNHFYQY